MSGSSGDTDGNLPSGQRVKLGNFWTKTEKEAGTSATLTLETADKDSLTQEANAIATAFDQMLGAWEKLKEAEEVVRTISPQGWAPGAYGERIAGTATEKLTRHTEALEHVRQQ
ncbi:hypothetical protein TRVL_01830 [Trypanosoma vivax]|nr:hypothetical protein TRVL_01830 [Trypanosoma vivax]